VTDLTNNFTGPPNYWVAGDRGDLVSVPLGLDFLKDGSLKILLPEIRSRSKCTFTVATARYWILTGTLSRHINKRVSKRLEHHSSSPVPKLIHTNATWHWHCHCLSTNITVFWNVTRAVWYRIFAFRRNVLSIFRAKLYNRSSTSKNTIILITVLGLRIKYISRCQPLTFHLTNVEQQSLFL
jgi:hypothetical protein